MLEPKMFRGMENDKNNEVYSKVVRAGKRTYFFDVKSTKKGDYYLTITESKKNFDQEGNFHYEKHKIFLYKEDFEKFAEGLQVVMDFIKLGNKPEPEITTETPQENFSDVTFEDLKAESPKSEDDSKEENT